MMERPPEFLVLDPDPAVREFCTSVLAAYGAVEGSGDSSPPSLEGRRVDLVLAGLRVYPLGGLELASFVRDKGIAPRVLVLSEPGGHPLEREAEARGHVVLRKPLSPNQLLRGVQRALGRLLLQMEPRSEL